jgi:hypothetical protein
MSFLSDLRTYFDDKIKEIDSNLSYFDDPEGEFDISESMAQKNYRLFATEMEGEWEGNRILENHSFTLQLFSPRGLKRTENYDALYCKALDIKYNIINPKTAKGNSFATEISSTAFNISSLENDDNTYKAELQFVIRRDLTI